MYENYACNFESWIIDVFFLLWIISKLFIQSKKDSEDSATDINHFDLPVSYSYT
jgi:hypothetical protein